MAFTADGSFLVASPFGEWLTHVYDLQSRRVVSRFFGTNAGFGMNERLDLIGTVCNDQGGATVRFIRLTDLHTLSPKEFGSAPPRIKVSELEDEYGWSPDILQVNGMSFSPKGDAARGVGGLPCTQTDVLVVSFPALNDVFSESEEFNSLPHRSANSALLKPIAAVCPSNELCFAQTWITSTSLAQSERSAKSTLFRNAKWRVSKYTKGWLQASISARDGPARIGFRWGDCNDGRRLRWGLGKEKGRGCRWVGLDVSRDLYLDPM